MATSRSDRSLSRLRGWACTSVVVLTAVACTTRDTVEPVPRRNSMPANSLTATSSPGTDQPGSTTPDSPEPQPTGPEVSEPDPSDTTEPDATPEATAPEATSPSRPSGPPTTTETDYLLDGDLDGWLYLGRWTGTEWETATSTAGEPRASSIGAGFEVGIHEIGVAPIDGETAANASACGDGRVGPVVSPNTRSPDDPGFGFGAVAFGSDWNTRPRPVALVDEGVEDYSDAGAAAFAGTVVNAVDGKIGEIVVADLDGDGDSESLVTFGGGGYSVLMLIDADTGESTTVTRSISAGGTPPSDYDTYRTLAVADLNGDGSMEFVIHSWRGAPTTPVSTATAYTYDGAQVTAVLSTSC